MNNMWFKYRPIFQKGEEMNRIQRKWLLATLLFLCTLLISVPTLAAPKLSKSSATLYVGNTLTLKATGFSGKVTWSSSKPKVATVKSGKVTAKKEGTTVITAKAGSTKKTCKVTVKNVSLSKSRLSLKVGDTSSLTLEGAKASQVEWSSTNRKVAAFTSIKGNKVTFEILSVGSAVIKATYKGKNYTCSITATSPTTHTTPTPRVTPTAKPTSAPLPVVPIGKIKMDPARATLLIGTSKRLTLKGAGNEVEWKSSNPGHLYIESESGNQCQIKAKSRGYSCITATYQGKKYLCRAWAKTSPTPTPTNTPIPTNTPTPTPTQAPIVPTQAPAVPTQVPVLPTQTPQVVQPQLPTTTYSGNIVNDAMASMGIGVGESLAYTPSSLILDEVYVDNTGTAKRMVLHFYGGHILSRTSDFYVIILRQSASFRPSYTNGAHIVNGQVVFYYHADFSLFDLEIVAASYGVAVEPYRFGARTAYQSYVRLMEKYPRLLVR